MLWHICQCSRGACRNAAICFRSRTRRWVRSVRWETSRTGGCSSSASSCSWTNGGRRSRRCRPSARRRLTSTDCTTLLRSAGDSSRSVVDTWLSAVTASHPLVLPLSKPRPSYASTSCPTFVPALSIYCCLIVLPLPQALVLPLSYCPTSVPTSHPTSVL